MLAVGSRDAGASDAFVGGEVFEKGVGGAFCGGAREDPKTRGRDAVITCQATSRQRD